VPGGAGRWGVNVSSCVSINDLTVRMAWIAGLAVVALVFAGWRKTARAQPKSPRNPIETPRRVPFEVAETVTQPYRPASLLRRVWAVVASSGLALVIGAVIATVTAFTLAWIVTTLTDLLKQ
jgi:ABC-type nitrate/sulfonate/bicarbonate transport system permease component